MATLRQQIDLSCPELEAIRHEIHAHPEIGFEEFRTSSLVAGKLREWGIEFAEKVGGTGVVGTIRGKRGGDRRIGLRADMDALPIHEATGLPYASQNPGRMHACGHDGHTTMLLGAARHLSANPDFAGTVNLIFQPAEEGLGGANAMLRDGLFERFPCDSVYGLHNFPGMPIGHFATREGAAMAAAGLFEVTITGKGGHAGLVEHAKYDLTTVLARYVLALQEVAAAEVTESEPAVIRAGEIVGHGGASLNVMPASVYVGGTMRCFSSKTRDLFNRRIEELAHAAAAQACEATAQVKLRWITTALVNSKVETKAIVRAARGVTGANVDPEAAPITGGEDFAYMMEARPGAFIFLGNGTAEDGFPYSVHTPKYNFNDRIIPIGVEYWVRLVMQELS